MTTVHHDQVMIDVVLICHPEYREGVSSTGFIETVSLLIISLLRGQGVRSFTIR
ncbi:hypothetical protein ACFLTH_17800 [Bacteroidota bacterium]